MKKIGIVGLGIMARGMTENYLSAGYEVFVWNRTASVCESYVKKGATACSTPKEVASKADIVFEVTANDESSRAVWTGADGILAGCDGETTVVASGTFTVQWTDELIDLVSATGAQFFDIPLTGGRVGAETGNLTMLAGGDEDQLEQLKPDLEPISAKVFHFGPAGHGMRYKLILNAVQASHLALYGEAMNMAKQTGMDIEKVSAGLVDRPGGVITQIAATAYPLEEIPLTFSIDWITKDLEYAKKMAFDVDTAIIDNVLAKFKATQASGHGNEDWAYVNK